jgi:hypothetical protein
MATLTRAQRREDQATQRRLQKARERLQREQARAQRHLQALEQALIDLGLPATLVVEVEWRLKALGKRLGNIVGIMFPTVFGCRTADELTRVRRGDKHRPGTILGALPQPTWGRQWPRRAQDLLATWWPPVQDKRPATRSRWPWTWVGDDRLFTKAGPPLGLVGTWWSGQEQRVRRGIDGLLLVVVIGAGKLVMPVAFTGRRPDPVGPGRPCRDQRTWWQIMLERPWAALQRRCRQLPPPLVVADRGCGDAKMMTQVAIHQHGSLVVEGQHPDVFQRPDGRRMTGQELRHWADWPWRDCLQLPTLRDVRLTATSPTDGPGTVVIVDAPGQARYDLRCQATRRTAPRLLRAWKRRSWIAHHCRVLKPLLAAEACQVHGEDADDGHLVWRLLAGLVLLDTARSLCKGRVTREEIVFSLQHHGRFLNAKHLE